MRTMKTVIYKKTACELLAEFGSLVQISYEGLAQWKHKSLVRKTPEGISLEEKEEKLKADRRAYQARRRAARKSI